MQAAAPWSKGLPGLRSHICAAASFHSTPASPAKWKGNLNADPIISCSQFIVQHEHGERKLSKIPNLDVDLPVTDISWCLFL
ncbi:hypothetical protein D1007_20243 [Hordeum vulgare]|nr:hypothetical protein D1007_20243 [Hordeum vulgare]